VRLDPVALATARLHLAQENARQPESMTPVPRRLWPTGERAKALGVWRSRDFLAVLYREEDDEGEVYERLTVNRTTLAADGRWADGITWDDLMRVKSECGLDDRWAVEVYPPSAAVVDVASMRHLWLLEEAPAFAWTWDAG
jgi:hypothetical protein